MCVFLAQVVLLSPIADGLSDDEVTNKTFGFSLNYIHLATLFKIIDMMMFIFKFPS